MVSAAPRSSGPGALALAEDGAVRRWLAGRAMRGPLVVLKFGSPLLVIATLALVLRQPNLAAQPLDVLWLLALPFGAPFVLALVYPFVRWMPQRWTLDATGLHGRGRARVDVPWDEVRWWGVAALPRVPGHGAVAIARGGSRERVARLLVTEAERRAIEGWLRHAAPRMEPRPLPALD
jgi:hypothetical protein